MVKITITIDDKGGMGIEGLPDNHLNGLQIIFAAGRMADNYYMKKAATSVQIADKSQMPKQGMN